MKKAEAGDTIVEVLIAIVIVSAVLVGAYTVANRSSQSIRISQERTVGAKYAAAMIEKLHANPATYPAAAFCAKNPGESDVTKCQADSLPGEEPAYRTFVTRSGTPATYIVTTQWDSLRGGEDKVVYVYRTAK